MLTNIVYFSEQISTILDISTISRVYYLNTEQNLIERMTRQAHYNTQDYVINLKQ